MFIPVSYISQNHIILIDWKPVVHPIQVEQPLTYFFMVF